MDNFWFVHFSTVYLNKAGQKCEIRGNAVFKLSGLSFLPGIVRKRLAGSLLQKLDSFALPADSQLGIVVEHFIEIDEKSALDFSEGKAITETGGHVQSVTIVA